MKPFLDNKLHRVFATRSPARPNKFGISVVRLKGIENNTLHVQDVDIIDGTPLIDIKPFVPEFDCRKTTKIGWFKGKIGKLESIKTKADFANDNELCSTTLTFSSETFCLSKLVDRLKYLFCKMLNLQQF